MTTGLTIGVVSCAAYPGRRQACRASWVRAAQGIEDVTILFMVGDPSMTEPRLDGDMLYVPSPDDYPSLPRKTKWLARWAAQAGAERLLKCDDDTFVHVGRLKAALPTLADDYVGYEVCKHVASGGGGYLLSRRAIEALAEQMPDHTGAEDVIASETLRRAGISLTPDYRFSPWLYRVPTLCNNQLTTHYATPAHMAALQESLDRPAPVDLLRVLTGHAEFGAVGVNGYRGFVAFDSARVHLPADIPTDGVFISAHASSSVTIDLARSARVSAFLDADSGTGRSVVDFRIDGQAVGSAARAGECTADVWLNPGRHRLEAVSRGHIACRYSVWQVREASP